MKTFRSLALLPWLLCVACGGSSDFTSGDSDDALDFDELPASYAAAQCELVERCAGPLYHVFFTLEDCATTAEARFRDGGFSALEAAVDAKTVSYDGKKAAECLDILANRECTEINQRTNDVCEAALTGTVKPGGDCTIDEECEGSRICDFADQCPGTCVEHFDAGHVCIVNDECADGLVCSEATSRCVAPPTNGEACGGGVEPQCDGGFLCAGENKDTQTTGTCRPHDQIVEHGAGEACTPTLGDLCAEGLSCVVQSITPAFTFACRANPAPGGACRLGIPENCTAGEYCPISTAELALGIVESNCVPLPEIGEPCAARPIDIGATCEAYARCDEPAGTCLGLRGLGESCSSDELCKSGNCESGGCAPVRACQ